jgi:RNA polymerase sigma-70 factor (ECF subfamily)
MVTSAFPVSLLNPTCIPAFECDPPRTPARRRQPDVVGLAQAGDEDAFSELYALHKKRVLSICMRMVHDFSLAEDLAQEAFLQLHRKLSSFRGDSAFTTWLHRLTVNVVLMHMRKRALPVVSLDQLMTTIPEERTGRDFGARDMVQAGVVDRLALDRAVAVLAPGYRCFYLLHDVEGFAHWEIAAMQRCSLGNSKSQLHKARRALRGALTAQGGSVAVEPETVQ